MEAARLRGRTCLVSLGLLILGTQPARAADRSAPRSGLSGSLVSSGWYAPLAFERHTDRSDKRVRYVARTGGATVVLTPTESVFLLPAKSRGGAERHGIPAHRDAVARSTQKLPDVVNSLVGKDPARWRTSVPTCAQVGRAAAWRPLFTGKVLLDMAHRRIFEQK